MAVRIPLPCGREAIISDKDRRLANKAWRYSQGYVICKVPQEHSKADDKTNYDVLRLHRVVHNTDSHIYFKDGDTLNCQRSNLTDKYTCRPGNSTGRTKGDPRNDGGWATKRAAKEKEDACKS